MRLIPGERVAHCFWSLADSWVTGKYSDAEARAFFKGLVVCGSVWGCPVCSARISETRRQEVAAALAYAEVLGLRAVPVTRTIRHSRADKLADLVERFRRARLASLEGRARAEFWDDFWVAGTITSLEVTHGANGWHVHSHEVWFVRRDADLDDFEARLLAGWQKKVVRAGLSSVTARGLKVEKQALTSAEYVTKFGRDRDETRWGVSHEVAKAVTKKGRQGGRTPLELLECYLEGDKQAGALWIEYYRAFEGRRQMFWSQGLRALLLPACPYLTDEDIAKDETTKARSVVKLLPVHWRAVQRVDARAAVLDAIEAGERAGGAGAVATVGALLTRLGCSLPVPSLEAFGEAYAASRWGLQEGVPVVSSSGEP